MNQRSPRGEVLPRRQSSNTKAPCIQANYLRCLAAIFAVLMTCGIPLAAHGQIRETASRIGDLQVGGGFVFSTSDYNFTPIHLIGAAGYTTFDMRNHWGGEFDFHHNRPTTDSTVYERTYEIGPRIFMARGPFIPYAKVMYGRGVYNFHNSVANVAYNLYTFGGGADFQLRRSLNLRADYEYQSWMGFPLGTLHPNVITIGVAYHFHE